MAEIFQEINLLFLLGLFVAGIVAFIISTISGGGGALILVPVLNFILGTTKTAPVLNLGTFIGRPARLILFWKHINWKVFWYYVPAAMLGAVIGNIIGKRFLSKMKRSAFRKLLITLMIISGILLIYNQLK